MRKIPPALREKMANDPYYKRCCVTGWTHEKIEWHHNLIFAGKQVNEKWCILPLSKSIHDNIQKYKEECDRIMLLRATEDDLRPYCKVIDYIAKKRSLSLLPPHVRLVK